MKRLIAILLVAVTGLFFARSVAFAQASDSITANVSGSTVYGTAHVSNPGDYQIRVYETGNPNLLGNSSFTSVFGNDDNSFSVSMTGLSPDATEITVSLVDVTGGSNSLVTEIGVSISGSSGSGSGSGSGGSGGINLGGYFLLGKQNKTVASVYGTPAVLVRQVVNALLVIGAIVYFLIIIYTGFKFVYQGSKGLEEARGILLAATAGFILMFAAYWIVQIVAFVTGANILL